MAMIPVDRLNGFRFFNAAFGGGTAAEAYYFIERYATTEELVVLGLELGQYAGPSSESDPFSPSDWNSILNNLLNVKTVEYSLRTLAGHWSGEPPSLRRDGSFNSTRWFELNDRPNPVVRDLRLGQMKPAYAGFTGPVPGSMAFYTRIGQSLQQRHIACVVLLPPLHEAVAKAVQSSPAAMEAYRAWRRELDLIFPNVVDLSLGPYCAAENFFKADPVHFKPEVGVRMLNEEVIPVAIRAVGRGRAGQP
jgi:hypothetical protein